MRRAALVLALRAATAGANMPPPPELLERHREEAMGRRLQETLAEHGADVHGCYGAALAAKPGLAGEVLFRVYVAPGGAIERVQILKNETGSDGLVDCLARSIKNWQAPRLAGADTQQVVFPLVFKPDETPPRIVVPSADGRPGPLPGGKLEARVLIDEVAVGKTQASLTRLDLPPGARLALHKHPGALELLYVLKGRAHLRDAAGALQNAETGDVALAEAGAPHSVEAAPLAPLELVQVFVPGGPERAYRDPKQRDGTVPAQKTKAAGDPGARPSVVHAADAKAWTILAGKGAATLLLDGRTPRASLQRLEAAAGAAVPQHQHDTSDEILFIVAGRGEMTVAGQKYAVGAGDAVRIPMATPHALQVSEKLVAVQVYAPAGPEQRFKGPPPAANQGPEQRP